MKVWGGLTFPQIEIGGRVVNGFADLRRLERSGELERPNPGIRFIIVGTRLDHLRRDTGEIGEATPRRTAFARGVVVRLTSTITTPMLVETQTSYDEHQPGGEFPAAIGGVLAKPLAVVASKLVERERVAVHEHVLVAAQEPDDAEDEGAVGGEERGPCVVARPRVADFEQRGEWCGECTAHG